MKLKVAIIIREDPNHSPQNIDDNGYQKHDMNTDTDIVQLNNYFEPTDFEWYYATFENSKLISFVDSFRDLYIIDSQYFTNLFW